MGTITSQCDGRVRQSRGSPTSARVPQGLWTAVVEGVWKVSPSSWRSATTRRLHVALPTCRFAVASAFDDLDLQRCVDVGVQAHDELARTELLERVVEGDLA